MDNNKSQMLKKLIEMKKELNQKQRKLEKMKRFARTRAHIRQKLSEHGNLVEDSCTVELPETRSPPSNIRSAPGNIRSEPGNNISATGNIRLAPGNIRSATGNIRSTASNIRSTASNIKSPPSKIRSPPSKIRSPSINIRSPSNIRPLPSNVSTWFINHKTGDSQAECPLSKVIKQSLKMISDIDIHDHNKGTCDVRKETDQECKQTTDNDSTAFVRIDNSCTQTVDTALTIKHSHGAIDDIEEDNKTENNCVKSVVDLCVNTSGMLHTEKTLPLSEEAQLFKSYSALGKSSESLGAERNFELKCVQSQLSHMTTERTTTDLQNLQTSHKPSVFVNCVRRPESEEAIVYSTQINSTLNPNFCSRKKQTCLGNDHLENTLPSTSSFEHLMDQFSSKNVLQTLSDQENYVYKPETVTDSEFFNVLGLSQKDGKALCQEITKNQTPYIEESERTLSQIGSSHDKMSVKSHMSQKLSNAAHVSVSSSENTSIRDCSSQHDIAGTRLQANCLNVGEFESLDCSQYTLVNSTNSFSEYTELDVIPYSQFELTEDFLSETQNSQEGINSDRHRAKKYGSLVKRRSSRISSYYFAHSISSSFSTNYLLPYSGSVSSDNECAVDKLKSKHTKHAAELTKAAAVLSVFQFLIDEAKKVNSFTEFKLPSVYDNLISCRLKCATVSNDCSSTHIYAENQDKNISKAEDSQASNVTSCSHRLSLKKNKSQQVSTVIKSDIEMKELSNFDEGNTRDAFRTGVEDPCIDEVLLESHLYSDSTELQDINTMLLNNKQLMSDRCVEKHSLGIDIRSDHLTEALANTRNSHVLSTWPHPVGILNDSITLSREKKMPIYKSRGKISHRSFGKSVSKMLFTAKNTDSCAEPHGSFNKTIRDIITTNSEICSSGTLMLPLESTSQQCVPLQEAHETFSVKCTSLTDRVVLTQSLIPVTSCDSPTILNTSCLSLQSNKMPLQMTTPESLWQSSNTEPGLNIHKQFESIDSEQATRSNLEVASSQFNSSLLCSPGTSACAAHSHPVLQISCLSLTSTPKIISAPRAGCDTSLPDFDISFEGNESSNEINRSLLHAPAERIECHKFKTPLPEMQSPLEVSKSVIISPSCQGLFPDKSCVPFVHSIEVTELHKENNSELLTDVTSAIRESNEFQNNVSSSVVTSNHFISPWKKLLKTAWSPVLVMEQNAPRNYQMTPVFSPYIRRSRSKLINNENRSQNSLKFSGCFQSHTQDAVVTILNGQAKTTDDKMKPYIVSIQATSLTVWTEDLKGWTAELDWKLASELHIMKACLLPRNDSIIAIAASGWNNQSLFATLFLYDWNTGDTTRYNIPLVEQQSKLQSPSQIELCSVMASDLDIAVTSDTHYIIGRVLFDNFLKSIKTVTMSQVQLGKLLGFVTVNGQVSASVSLTADQEITVWNMKLSIAVKKIKVQSSLPCLTRLLNATSHKGILLLDTVWRVDDGDCGGVIIVNPLTGYTQKIVTFSVPNNTWKRIESAQSEASFVMAISDKGSLSIWNKQNGALLGYTKSKTMTCASIVTPDNYLIVGDIQGCLHIYSTSH